MASNNKTKQDRQALAATADKLSTLPALLEKQTERTEAAALLAENAAADCHKNLTMAIGSAECARDFCKCARAYSTMQAVMFWVTLGVTIIYTLILFYSLA